MSMANKKNTENIKKPITVSKIKEDKRTPKKIKKEKKIKMIIVLLIIIILIIFVLIKIAPIKKQVNDNLIYNNNKSFIKQQKIDEIVFENIKCSYDMKSLFQIHDGILHDAEDRKSTRLNSSHTDSSRMPYH